MTMIDPRTAELQALHSLSIEDLTRELYELETDGLATLFTRLGDDGLAELLAELEATDAARLVGRLSRAQAADVLEEMAPDDAADVMAELEDDEAAGVLNEMEPDEASDIRTLLQYPPETAGGLMTPNFIAIPSHLTSDAALSHVRHTAREAETIYYFYVTEPPTDRVPTGRLLGVLSLRRLLRALPEARVRDLMDDRLVKVRADADQEEAARLLDQYHLLAIPVVDEQDRLLGIITQDDAHEVLEEEANEDVERLGGSQPLDEPYLRASVYHLFKKRVFWLLALFIAEAYTGSVLRFYEETLSEQIELTFFIPLLIGTAGNTGSQTVTTLVRAMAVGEVSTRDLLKVVRKESLVGVSLGFMMAAATIIRASTLGVSVQVGQVVGLTAMAVVVWAAFCAAILPLALRKLRVDPAVVSAPFITTLVDGTGLIIYFNLAQILLHLH